MKFKELIDTLSHSPYVFPNFCQIPNENIAGDATETSAFEAKMDYFTITVNEMYILEGRRWFTELEPMVICLSEYVYDEAFVSNPFIVGSNLLSKMVKGDGKGFYFKDTRVAGIHPYAGGRIVLSIGLYENETDNYLKKSMKFLESISSVFNSHVTVFLKNITSASKVIMDGVDEFLQSRNTKPLFGFRIEFDPAQKNAFTPGYYVLYNKTDKPLDRGNFFVEEGKLKYLVDGQKRDFRETEYILFSFFKSKQRNDDNLLPLYKNYKAIIDLAREFTTIGDQEKEKIKDMFRTLNFDMAKSPDLTEPDAKRLINQYFGKIKELVNARFVLGAKNENPGRSFWTDMDDQISDL